jgi:hypothetical protein
MKFINIIKESSYQSKLDNIFYRKCLNMLSNSEPDLKDFFWQKVYCDDCFSDTSIIYSNQYKRLVNFFKHELSLENKDTKNLVFLYLINIDVNNFLTDRISTGEGFRLTFISCTSPNIEEDYREESYQCGECDGDGDVSCGECDGEGNLECGYCGGSGSEIETDGEGEEQEIECSECRGAGNETCGECDGSGKVSCDYCDGAGEQHTRDHYYQMEEISYMVIATDVLEWVNSDVDDFFERNSKNIYMTLDKEYVETIQVDYEEEFNNKVNEIIDVFNGNEITLDDIEKYIG